MRVCRATCGAAFACNARAKDSSCERSSRKRSKSACARSGGADKMPTRDEVSGRLGGSAILFLGAADSAVAREGGWDDGGGGLLLDLADRGQRHAAEVLVAGLLGELVERLDGGAVADLAQREDGIAPDARVDVAGEEVQDGAGRARVADPAEGG